MPTFFFGNRFNHIQKSLLRAKAFGNSLHADFQKKPARSLHILNIRGKGYGTKGRGIWHEKGGYFLRKPKDFKKREVLNNFQIFQDGDDTVTLKSARIPSPLQMAFGSKDLILEESHGSLFNHPESRRAIISLIHQIVPEDL